MLQYLSFFADFVKVMPGDLVAPLLPSIVGLVLKSDGAVCSDLHSQPFVCVATLRVLQNIVESDFVHLHLPSKDDTLSSVLEFGICIMNSLGTAPNKDLCAELLPFVQSVMRTVQSSARPDQCTGALSRIIAASSNIFLSEDAKLHVLAAKNVEQLLKAVITEDVLEKAVAVAAVSVQPKKKKTDKSMPAVSTGGGAAKNPKP